MSSTFNAQTHEFERLLLGCYLTDTPMNEAISADMFQTAAHKSIFATIRELRAQNIQPDITILAEELIKRGKLKEVGGYDKIAELTSGAFPSKVVFYEVEVQREFQRHSAWRAAVQLQEALKNRTAPDQAIPDAIKKLSDITAARPQADWGILFSDLLKKQFPPDSWYVENLIGSGLTVLTGASKIGKSWTAIQLVTALDQGGYFMGMLKANQHDVLYLALEDTPKRIQKRLLKQGVSTAFNGSLLETTRCTVSALRSFLKSNPQFRVVIIDTLQKMLGMSDLNDYAQTVDGLSALKAIADDLDRAIVVIHHNRKGGNEDGDHMESALGSTGINATADCTLTMRRKRGASEATLSVTGRDVEDASYSLSWDKELCSWSVTEHGELKPTLTEAQQQIIDLLESEDRSWTVGEIAKSLGKGKSTISEQAKKLAEIGLINCPIFGQYKQKTPFGRSVSLRETEQPNDGESVTQALETTTASNSTVNTTRQEPEIW